MSRFVTSRAAPSRPSLSAPASLIGPHQEASRYQLDDLGVRHETKRPGRSDVGVDRALRDTIRGGPAVRQFELGAWSEGLNLFEQPDPLLGSVNHLLPADQVVPVKLQGCGELIVRDDRRIEGDVERAR